MHQTGFASPARESARLLSIANCEVARFRGCEGFAEEAKGYTDYNTREMRERGGPVCERERGGGIQKREE